MADRRRPQRPGGGLDDGHAPPERSWLVSTPARLASSELLGSLTPDEVADERYRDYVRGVCGELDAHRLELTSLLGG